MGERTDCSSRWPRSLVAVAVLMIAASCTTSSAESDGSPSVDVRGLDGEIVASVDGGPLVGVAVPGGAPSRLEAVESSTGTRFDLIRVFARWDTVFPDADHAQLTADRRIHLSIRPVTSTGVVVPWADLVTAAPGDVTYGQLSSWIDRIVALEPGSVVTINHEPETVESRANGDSEDYVAMWRRFVELLRDAGGDHVTVAWVMTGGAFSDERAAQWYPGDDVVDVIGADVYNWHTCQGTERPWQSLEDLIAPPLAFARERGKPLALPEFASVEDTPGRKAAWLDDAADTLTNPRVASDLAFVAWFDVTAPGGTWPNCVWDHDSSPESAASFASFVSDLSAQSGS